MRICKCICICMHRKCICVRMCMCICMCMYIGLCTCIYNSYHDRALLLHQLSHGPILLALVERAPAVTWTHTTRTMRFTLFCCTFILYHCHTTTRKMCMLKDTCTHTYACARAYTRAYAHPFSHTYAHTYAHTCAHAHKPEIGILPF
jgi:hypothetical protein